MKCPACSSNKILSMIVWIAVPYWHIVCPDCGTMIKPRKTGIVRFSTYILALPAGIMAALGMLGLYWNTGLFLTICVFTLALDYIIDMKYIQLSPIHKNR